MQDKTKYFTKRKLLISIFIILFLISCVFIGSCLIYKFTPKIDSAPSPSTYTESVGDFTIIIYYDATLGDISNIDAMSEGRTLYIYSITYDIMNGYMWTADTCSIELEEHASEVSIFNETETLTRNGNVWYFDDPFIYNAGNAPLSFNNLELEFENLVYAENFSPCTVFVTFDIHNYIALNSNTLTLDPAGGNVSPTTMEVTNGQSVGTLPTPTRNGYRFAGWYIGDTLINSGDTWNYSADQTAVAHWVQQFILTICSNNTEFGVVTNEVNNQLMDTQSVVQSYGVGNIGYTLLYWKDDLGNKIYENPLNITLTRDSVYTAVFGKAVELNGICAVDINLISETTATEVVGYAALNGYSTDNLTSVHLWATPSKGYKFEYWTVDGEILTIDGTTPYTAVCDIPLSLVQGKIVVANFSKIDNSSVNDNINN